MEKVKTKFVTKNRRLLESTFGTHTQEESHSSGTAYEVYTTVHSNVTVVTVVYGVTSVVMTVL